MGIKKERIIFVNKPMQFRSITVPDHAQKFSDEAFTKEFLIPYQIIKSHVTPGTKKKVYLTRREIDKVIMKYGQKACFNERYFEDFFVAHGFEAVALEKLPIEEQISIIMGADEIASTGGTLSHWVIFCKPTAKFIMLTRTKNYLLSKQCQLMEAFNFRNYYIVDGSHNLLLANPYRGIFMLGSNEYWKKFVLDYFNEQIELDEGYTYINDCLDSYVDFWYKKYSLLGFEGETLSAVNSLKDLCRRFLTLERKLGGASQILTYRTHVHSKGWSAWIGEDQPSNQLSQQLDIQAIQINSPNHRVYYSVYYGEEEDWSQEVANGEQAGTTGKSKPIYGMRVYLDEAGAKDINILYRMHKFDGTWTPWAKNGEAIYSHGVKLNAIQIKLEPINPAKTDTK